MRKTYSYLRAYRRVIGMNQLLSLNITLINPSNVFCSLNRTQIWIEITILFSFATEGKNEYKKKCFFCISIFDDLTVKCFVCSRPNWAKHFDIVLTFVLIVINHLIFFAHTGWFVLVLLVLQTNLNWQLYSTATTTTAATEATSRTISRWNHE